MAADERLGLPRWNLAISCHVSAMLCYDWDETIDLFELEHVCSGDDAELWLVPSYCGGCQGRKVYDTGMLMGHA